MKWGLLGRHRSYSGQGVLPARQCACSTLNGIMLLLDDHVMTLNQSLPRRAQLKLFQSLASSSISQCMAIVYSSGVVLICIASIAQSMSSHGMPHLKLVRGVSWV